MGEEEKRDRVKLPLSEDTKIWIALTSQITLGLNIATSNLGL